MVSQIIMVLAGDHFDVTYYCKEPNQNKENIFCPLVNVSTRFPETEYRFKLLKIALDKYENDILIARRKNNK